MGQSNPDRIEHQYSLYHRCFLKIPRRKYAELIYGADVFKNDPLHVLRRDRFMLRPTAMWLINLSQRLRGTAGRARPAE